MSGARLPAHLEVSALRRAVEAAGGFATVLARGENEAGTLLVICSGPDAPPRAFERMPQRDGTRYWTMARAQSADDPASFAEYCQRRRRQDPDLWIVELDIADAERFLAPRAATA